MRTLLFTALAAASFSAVATQPLLPAGGSDQVPQRVVSLPAPTGQFERAPVSFSWALDPAAELAAVICMQLRPFCAPECLELCDRFERALYRQLRLRN